MSELQQGGTEPSASFTVPIDVGFEGSPNTTRLEIDGVLGPDGKKGVRAESISGVINRHAPGLVFYVGDVDLVDECEQSNPFEAARGRIVLDPETRLLIVDVQWKTLGLIQSSLLELLMLNRGLLQEMSSIKSHLWGEEDRSNTALHIQVCRLRRNLGGFSGMIGSLPNGYIFNDLRRHK